MLNKTATPPKTKKRDMHLHIDPEHDEKLTAIKNKLWKDQNRTGQPSDIAGFVYAVNLAHSQMFGTQS